MLKFLRHPLIHRASSTFILCSGADVTSQLFLSSPVTVDPDRVVRFATSGTLAVIPVFFGWSKFLGGPVTDAASMLRRVAMEALLLGPLYLSSLLWWNTSLKTLNPVDGLRSIQQSAFSLYLDALKVVPAYNAFTYFAIAPHMRGYALTAFQFCWNVYVAWFVDDAASRFTPTTGAMLELPLLSKRSPPLSQ